MDRVLRVRLRHGQRQEVANTLPIVRVRLSQGGRMGGGGGVGRRCGGGDQESISRLITRDFL